MCVQASPTYVQHIDIHLNIPTNLHTYIVAIIIIIIIIIIIVINIKFIIMKQMLCELKIKNKIDLLISTLSTE